MPMTKITPNQVDGVLLLNKPLEISSNLALQKVKRIFNAKKAGHTGTLDPLATGLLPICFGEATKFSAYAIDAAKEYIATVKLGLTTDTYDKEGTILTQNEVKVTSTQIESVLGQFVGEISQIPPIYSAIKIKGKPLYHYARNDIAVEIQARNVTIYSLELLEFIDNATFKLKVNCSKGTYIRSLAHDIGNKLGCGAILYDLVRTSVLSFKLNPELTLPFLENSTIQQRQALLLPVDSLVMHLPQIELNDAEYEQIIYGRSFKFYCNQPDCDKIRLYKQRKFLGVATCIGGMLKPSRLIQFNHI